MSLAIRQSGDKAFFGKPALSLNGIMSSALSALQSNQTALSVVSNNVANVNTQGYARRTVNFEAQSAGGQLAGVDIASVQRVADQFLDQEVLSAQSSSSLYSTQSNVYDQINSLLGTPGDGTDLTSQLSDVQAALGQAQLDPTSSAGQLGVLNSLQGLSNTISSLSSSLSGLQSQTDGQIGTTVSSANSLIQQIYSLNTQIATADASGDTSSALLDQQSEALQNLSQLMDVRTAQNSNGTVTVSTQDGINLVGSTYAQLSYTSSNTPGVYQPIQIQNVNPATGQTIGQSQALDPDLSGGTLAGLISMRDGALSNLQNELGSFAQGVAQAFNAQSNANAAYPPPTTLSGRDTGLLSSDALNFTGQTTIAITNADGQSQGTATIDFDNGTISGSLGSASFSNSVGSFVTALNSVLGSSGSASFANGQLSISATGTNGVVVQDDASDPTSRGGTAFSQFFGLNDLFQASAPSILATGLSSGDAGGLNNGGEIDLQLKGPSGDIAKTASVTVSSSMTIGQVVSALNTALGGSATVTLNSDGSLTTTPSANYSGYQLQVTNDTTERGSTGMSFSELFGLGSNQLAQQAQNFQVNPAVVSNPALLGFATPDVTSSQVVGSGDSSGLEALQALATSSANFPAAGDLAAQTTTLSNYAGAFYQDIATQSSNATANQTSQSDRLTEAQTRQSDTSGVNIDEELSNMMIYQQAYSAGARMLTTVDSLYQTLLAIQ